MSAISAMAPCAESSQMELQSTLMVIAQQHRSKVTVAVDVDSSISGMEGNMITTLRGAASPSVL